MPTSRTLRATPRSLAYRRSEEPGYGATSYILFAEAPADERSQALLLAYANQFPSTHDFVGHRDASLLNVTYVPVTDKPPDDSTSKDAKWLCAHYDLARAQIILQSQGLDGRGRPIS